MAAVFFHHATEAALDLVLYGRRRDLLGTVLPGRDFVEEQEAILIAVIEEEVRRRTVPAHRIGAQPLDNLHVLADQVPRRGRAPLRVVLMAIDAADLDRPSIQEDAAAPHPDTVDTERRAAIEQSGRFHQTVFGSRVWGVVFGPSSDVVYCPDRAVVQRGRLYEGIEAERPPKGFPCG